MKNRLVVGALTSALALAGLSVLPTAAEAAAPPPVVTISVSGSQTVVSQSVMRPGIVEFRVGKTFTVPGPDGGPEMLTVAMTDQLPVILAALPAAFADASEPAAAAAAAAAMRTIHAAGTMYGGGNQGTTWRTYLQPGNYVVFAAQSAAMGLTAPASFTVTGAPRAGVLPRTQATIRAVGPVGRNKWTFRQNGDPVKWIRYTNAAQELHFVDMAGVKPGTSNADIKKAFSSPKEPKFFTGTGLTFDVTSPGVSVAIKGPVDAGEYLLTCFIPSESDGMPHALMGMWKLVDVN